MMQRSRKHILRIAHNTSRVKRKKGCLSWLVVMVGFVAGWVLVTRALWQAVT